MDSFNERVGKRIRETRAQNEVTQTELAAKAGCTQASISNYENGKRTLPLDVAVSVAKTLQMSLGDLVS